MVKTTISLDSFAGGAVLEHFRQGMAQIGRNIMDPNTDPEKKRSLTIKLIFSPDKSRRSVKTAIAMEVKTAPPLADETVMLIGQDLRSGRIEMSEYGNRNQSVSMDGGQFPVRAEEMAPVRTYDPATGEIFENAIPAEPKAQGAPIDLRAGN